VAAPVGRWVRSQAPFLFVLALFVAALCYLAIVPGHWRRGTTGIAVIMFVAALLRASLSDQRAGLLAARGRWPDAAIYVVLGALILIVDLRLH
jgi:hypothetical protein